MFETGVERADVKLFLLCAVLGLTGWAGLCRLLRGETLKLRELEYVQAASAFGVSHGRIMVRHIFPNVAHLMLIVTVLEFSALILYEAVLSYVGVGVDPSMNSFGGMINFARNEMSRDPVVWWPFAAAFTFMVALVLAANLFADGVRDAFDPRARAFRPRVLRKKPCLRRPRPCLKSTNVKVALDSEAGLVKAIDGMRLTLRRGETFALVGESGCGKSMTALALMRLLPENGRITDGEIRLDGAGHARAARGRHARDPRRQDRHDLPGAGHEPEPGDARRRPDRRGDRDAHAAARRGGARAGGRVAAQGRHPRARAAHRRLPVPHERRPEAARDDRDDARRRARLPGRRRADDGARRDDPGADPRPAEGAAEGARPRACC